MVRLGMAVLMVLRLPILFVSDGIMKGSGLNSSIFYNSVYIGV